LKYELKLVVMLQNKLKLANLYYEQHGRDRQTFGQY
jgi:hypothetical protein